jgi:acetyl-CoA carboxylase biotin carboxyl carrier protein
MGLTDDDVREILRIIDESPLEELRIQTEGFSLHVAKGPATKAPAPPPAPEPEPAEAGRRDGLPAIEAPMLGTFYRAEGPGQEPFVDVGTRVEPDTIVCIIEVMKMMNSVPAGVSGTIAEVCAENAELVESGQPLFRVRPASA